MALKIRLRQQGRRHHVVYRLVLTDSRAPRDGKYIEMLGWYNPHEKEESRSLHIEEKRVEHWLGHGAILTEKAESLVKRGAPEVISAWKRRVQKARAKVCEKKKSGKKKEVALAS